MIYFYEELNDKYGWRFVSIFKEIINEIPIEFHDLKYFCNILGIKDHFQYHLNQKTLKNEIYKQFNLIKYDV